MDDGDHPRGGVLRRLHILLLGEYRGSGSVPSIPDTDTRRSLSLFHQGGRDPLIIVIWHAFSCHFYVKDGGANFKYVLQ